LGISGISNGLVGVETMGAVLTGVSEGGETEELSKSGLLSGAWGTAFNRELTQRSNTMIEPANKA
jgi:hypothetical protein